MVGIELGGLFVDVQAGAYIEKVIEESLKLARAERKTVNFIFNDKHVRVYPYDNFKDVEMRYMFKVGV